MGAHARIAAQNEPRPEAQHMPTNIRCVGRAALLSWVLLGGDVWAAQPDLRLVTAAQTQDAAAIQTLLGEGVDVNAARADGVTPLLWAAYWNDLDTAALLLRAGANIDTADDQGMTPLLGACENGSAAMVAMLLSAGANAASPQANGVTPLMLAARTGSLDIIRTLIAHGADTLAAIPATGQTALMWATAEGHLDVMGTLIAAGADIHSSSSIGFTPLLFAVRNGDIEAATALLADGADVNAPGSDGTHALPLAVVSGHDMLARFLLDRGADPNSTMAGVPALHAAVASVDMWLRDWLRTRRVSVFVEGTAGLASSLRLALVETLLEHGADPNSRITTSTTIATHVSGKYGARGSFTVGTGDLRGATPLWVAAHAANPTALAIMPVLLEAGGDLHLTTDDGTTPLMVAAGLGSPTFGRSSAAVDVVTLLGDAGADIRAVNEADFTALHGGAFRGSNEIIQYLLDHGADIDAQDFRGRTPYRLAEGAQRPLQFQGWPGTAAFLETAGADTTLGATEDIGTQQPGRATALDRTPEVR